MWSSGPDTELVSAPDRAQGEDQFDAFLDFYADTQAEVTGYFNLLKNATGAEVTEGSISGNFSVKPEVLARFIDAFKRSLIEFTSATTRGNSPEVFVLALNRYRDYIIQDKKTPPLLPPDDIEIKDNTTEIVADIARKMALEIAKLDIKLLSPDYIQKLRRLISTLQKEYGGEIVQKRWKKLISGPFELALAVLDGKKIIFSGGSSNYIDENGEDQRGTGRDYLNQLFDEDSDIDGDGKSDNGSIVFYDPQIHEDTHGRKYDYAIDGPTEALARDLSEIAIYEIANTTLSFVTMMEIIRDVAKGKKVVFWMSDEFIPIKPNNESDRAKLSKIFEVHLASFSKAEKNVRSYFMKFARQFKDEGYPVNFEYVTDSAPNQERKRKPWFDENTKTILHFDIYKDRFSADILIRALMRIAERRQTTIVFHDISEGQESDVSLLKQRYENTNGETKDGRVLQEGVNLYQRFGNKMRDLFFRWHKTKKHDYEMNTEDTNPNHNVAQLAVDGGSAASLAKNRIMPIPEDQREYLRWLLHEAAD